MRALPDAVPLERRDLLIAAGLFGLVIGLGGWRMVPGVTGAFHDDAIYVITAKALAQGDGYRLTNLPGDPLQTKYPILYPAMLAVVWMVWPDFPDNLLAMQWLTLSCGAAAIGLTFLFLVRFGYATRATAAAACGLAATAPFVLHVSTLTLSEMPFALTIVLALWALERLARDPVPPGTSWLLGCAVGLPFLCRTIGLALVPAALLVLAVRRRSLRWPIAGMAVPVVPWLLWASLGAGTWQAGAMAGYYTDYAGAWSAAGLPSLGAVVRLNALLLAHAVTATSFAGLGAWTLDAGPVLVVLGVVAWAAVALHARQFAPVPVFLGAYAIACLVWPWPPLRFVLPVLPLVLVYLARGSRSLLAAVLPWRAAAGVLGLTAALGVATNLRLDSETAALSRAGGFPVRRADTERVEWRAYDDLFRWVRRETPPDAVMASGLDTMVSAYTNRHAIRPFVHRPDELFYVTVDGTGRMTADLERALTQWRIDYLVVVPMPDFAEDDRFHRSLADIEARRPELLQVAYRGSDPRFQVLAVCARTDPPDRVTGPCSRQ